MLDASLGPNIYMLSQKYNSQNVIMEDKGRWSFFSSDANLNSISSFFSQVLSAKLNSIKVPSA